MHKTLRRQILLTAEDLLRNFGLGEEKEEKVYPHFKENKYDVFDWGLSGVVPNPDSETTGSIFFIQAMCFAIMQYNSNYYIFD